MGFYEYGQHTKRRATERCRPRTFAKAGTRNDIWTPARQARDDDDEERENEKRARKEGIL